MWTRIPLTVAPALLAVYMPMCAAHVRPTAQPWDARMRELWQLPEDLASRDLFYGPWGESNAPDPQGVYRIKGYKDHGTNPGLVVVDQDGREWHVKQPPNNHQGAEGPVEVVLSRVLSAVGYHQPPVYFLPSFTVEDETGARIVPGGRFRLSMNTLKKEDIWSWQQNPFVGTKPYQGLLVILMMFDSSDLKNDNNSLYRHTRPDGTSEVLSQGLCKAVWTDDLAASTRISPQVAHYTGQAELAESIQEGIEAHRAGDLDQATAKLGRAVRLAHESGNEDTFRLLQKVVDVVDPVEGTVRFRKNVSEADEMTLETRSTKTVRVAARKPKP